MTFKSLVMTALLLSAASMLAVPSAAQVNDPDDEVVATGTLQKDPAMTAYLSGDFVTAELEFKRNAFCALRASRDFEAGKEAARDGSLRAEIPTGADTVQQPIGNANGPTTIISAPTTGPAATINSSGLQRNKDESKRTCEDRGFQLYMAGLSQIKLGKNAEAKDSFTRATVLRKSLHDAHFRLGLLEYQDGNLKKAKKQLRKLKKLEARCRRCEFKEEMQGQVRYLQNLLG